MPSRSLGRRARRARRASGRDRAGDAGGDQSVARGTRDAPRLVGADIIAADGFGAIGALEVASLHMVLTRNPLENIPFTTDIKYVVKGGVVYDDDTLDEVWPRDRT